MGVEVNVYGGTHGEVSIKLYENGGEVILSLETAKELKIQLETVIRTIEKQGD